MDCFLIEPIHPVGIEAIRRQGIAVRRSSAPNLATVAAEIGGADIVVTRGTGINAAAIDAAARLGLICHHGVGLNAVDVAHATARSIPVTYTPDANIQSVAEQAILLMLAVARRVVSADKAMRAGDYDFKYRNLGMEMAGKTLGIVGFGRTGRAVAKIAAAGLGMRIAVYTRNPSANAATASYRWCATLHELLAESDVISIHAPLTETTRNMIAAAELAAMRPHAILVNVSRGGVVDESALDSALRNATIAGAGIDVFTSEKAGSRPSFADLDNVVLSPHLGGVTTESMVRIANQIADQISSAVKGVHPANLVNPEIWPKRRMLNAP